MSLPKQFPCLALNAGGAGDDSRYSLARITALAESLLRGVNVDAAPIAIVERSTSANDMLALFKQMLPLENIKGNGKPATIKLNVPDADEGVKVHEATLESVKGYLESFHDQDASYAVVNGTSRTLALFLIAACGLKAPEYPTVEVEGTDAELRDMSAQSNTLNDFAKKMTPHTRQLYALSLYDSGIVRETDIIAKARVGRGIGQLMYRSAAAIRKHGLQPDANGRYPSLDKEEWQAVLKAEAGSDISNLLAPKKEAPRIMTLQRLKDVATRAPAAGTAGDMLRAIVADDVQAVERLLGVAV